MKKKLLVLLLLVSGVSFRAYAAGDIAFIQQKLDNRKKDMKQFEAELLEKAEGANPEETTAPILKKIGKTNEDIKQLEEDLEKARKESGSTTTNDNSEDPFADLKNTAR